MPIGPGETALTEVYFRSTREFLTCHVERARPAFIDTPTSARFALAGVKGGASQITQHRAAGGVLGRLEKLTRLPNGLTMEGTNQHLPQIQPAGRLSLAQREALVTRHPKNPAPAGAAQGWVSFVGRTGGAPLQRYITRTIWAATHPPGRVFPKPAAQNCSARACFRCSHCR